ncbi:MAG TPA: ABC transporter ATP-binding protein [Acidimicrobiales bacterium]|nr:ABC transporter ATP-binding protein [Acidimicrobiales bacterium]
MRGVVTWLRRADAAVRSFHRSIVWRMLARQKGWLIALAVTATISGLVAIGTVLTIRDLLDEALIDKIEPLEPFVVELRRLAFYGLISGITTLQIGARIGYHLEYELRLWLYQRLQATNPRLLDALASGQVVTRSLTDLGLLEAIILVVPGVAFGAIALVAIFTYLLLSNPIMALVALAAIPVNFVIIRRIRRHLWGLSWLVLNRRAEVTAAIDEPVRGIRVVKAFGREDHARGSVRDAARKAYAVGLTRVRLVARYDLILQALPTLLNAALLFIGGRQVANGRITVGNLVIYFAVASIFTGLASSFDEIVSGWTFAGTGAGRIFELVTMDEHADPTTLLRLGAEGSDPLPPPGDGLVLRDVTVGLGPLPLAEHVDLAVGPGELTLLTGSPGSGKSLLAGIATAAAAPLAGTVLLDGVDVATLDLDAARGALRLLPEDPFLFSRSVRENLCMGATGIADERLWTALRAAAVDDVVTALPGGLDNELGDRGLTLSGGQRQRMALARALVVPPRVLVLDDALSAVNPSLEADIVRRVRELCPALALLVITRRDNLARVADHTVRLADAPADFAVKRDAGAKWLRELFDQLDAAPTSNPLAEAVAQVPADRHAPTVSDAVAERHDQVPSVRNTIRPFLKAAVWASVLMLVVTLARLLPDALVKFAVDDFATRRHAVADRVVVAIMLTGFAIGALSFAFKLASVRVTEGVMYVLRMRIVSRLTRIGVDYYDRELPGRVAARVVHDLERIMQLLESGLARLASITLLVGTIVVLYAWSPPVARVVSVYLFIAVVLTVVQVPFAARAFTSQRLALGDVVGRFQEDLAGRYVVDQLGARREALDGFGRVALRLRSTRRFAAGLSNVYVQSIQFVLALGVAHLLARAGDLALAGTLSLGSVVALQLYLVNALAPIPYLGGVLQNYLAARASFRTLGDPFRAPVLPAERAGTLDVNALAGEIAFDEVTFAYPGTTAQVLRDVSLTIAPGTVVAIVGATGAGKSSLAKLAARIYDPDVGAVRADGHDLRNLDLGQYRQRLGVVPQDAFCFRGTVRDNLAYALPNASDEQLRAAAIAVGGLEALTALPEGFDGRVEEDGRNLTAAQRQYLALARAALRQPDVFILDEATASLDAEGEQRVLDAIRALGKTVLMITHRLPVARHADLVLVVADGRVVEQGAHDQLMVRRGHYAALWESGEEIESVPVASP